MKTHLARLAVLGGALELIATLATGCLPTASDESASTGVSNSVEFTPSSVDATRTPASCGVTEPPFSSRDTFTLEVVGNTAATPSGTLTLQLAANVATSVPISLVVGVDAAPADSSQAASAGLEVAASSDGKVQLSLTLGSDTDELDSSGLASVTVTVDSMPTSDGHPLSAEVQLEFDDGRDLDQTFTATVRSAVVLCSRSSLGS